jgi:acyl dehydratase
MEKQMDAIEVLADLLGFNNGVNTDGHAENETRIKKLYVTGDMVNTYVEISGDANPIHTHVEAAQKAGFARPIAHGTLLSGLVFSALVELYGHNLSIMEFDVAFKRPVYIDSNIEIHLTAEATEGTSKKIKFEIKTEKNNRLKQGVEGFLVCNESAGECDVENLEKSLLIAWLAKATAENFTGIAVTNLGIEFQGQKVSREMPELELNHGEINPKFGNRKTLYKGLSKNDEEVYHGYYIVASKEWVNRS